MVLLVNSSLTYDTRRTTIVTLTITAKKIEALSTSCKCAEDNRFTSLVDIGI